MDAQTQLPTAAPGDGGLDGALDGVLDDVVDVLVRVLAIEDRRQTFDASTPLLGELPELDSLAVVELAVALEERFGIVIDDDDFTGEVFDTVGTLAEFIAAKVRGA